MNVFRFLCRILAIIFWSIITLFVVGSSLLFAQGVWQRRQRAAAWTRWWARGVAWLIGLKINVHGQICDHDGTLIVANHLGYLDIPALASVFKLRFTPKAEIKKWPFFGWLTGLNQPIWIDRKARILAKEYSAQFQETLNNGVSLVVFPEGTSTDGLHGILPFKSTSFDSALGGALIQPVLLFYHDGSKARNIAPWHDDTLFFFHLVRVLGLKAVVIDVYIMKVQTVLPGENRKQMAQRIHDLMENEYWRIGKNEQNL